MKQSRRPESNWRPPHYECGALPTELRRRVKPRGGSSIGDPRKSFRCLRTEVSGCSRLGYLLAGRMAGTEELNGLGLGTLRKGPKPATTHCKHVTIEGAKRSRIVPFSGLSIYPIAAQRLTTLPARPGTNDRLARRLGDRSRKLAGPPCQKRPNPPIDGVSVPENQPQIVPKAFLPQSRPGSTGNRAGSGERVCATGMEMLSAIKQVQILPSDTAAAPPTPAPPTAGGRGP